MSTTGELFAEDLEALGGGEAGQAVGTPGAMLDWDLSAFSAQLRAAILDSTGDNGSIAVGMGVTSDERNPPPKCIPVPVNIDLAKRPEDRIRIAMWAAGKITPTAFRPDIQVAMIYVSYMCGLIRYRPYTQRNARYPTRTRNPEGTVTRMTNDRLFALMQNLGWVTEVNVFNEEVPNLGEDFNDEELARFIAERPTRGILQLATALVICSKLTWFSTKHHLGADIGTGAIGRQRYGFLEKFITSLTPPPFDMSNDIQRTALHEIIHPPSVHGIFQHILKGPSDAAIIADLSVTFDAICLASGKPIGGAPLKVGADVKMRALSSGAGTRRFMDICVGIKHIATSMIWPLCPLRGEVASLSGTYAEIAAHPLAYGDNADFLCGKGAKEANMDVHIDKWGAVVSSFLRTIERNSSLVKAAFFKQVPTDLPGYDDNWHQVCGQFYAARSTYRTAPSAQVKAVLSATGLGAAAMITDIEDEALAALGAPGARQRFHNVILAIQEAAGGVENPEEPIVEENPEE